MNKLLFFSISILFCINESIYSQTIWEHNSNHGIYEFLDELANDNVIELNSAIKPYSGLYISNHLLEAKTQTENLSKRQIVEIDFYLKNFQMGFSSMKKNNLNRIFLDK
ncbi:MAG: hypothetical protein JEZ03_15045, partial [Bacteroidales bacterium]|nr:hypothetical protein [Bacteroidales bacterium]